MIQRKNKLPFLRLENPAPRQEHLREHYGRRVNVALRASYFECGEERQELCRRASERSSLEEKFESRSSWSWE